MFKEQACPLGLNGTHSVSDAARELGLSRETLVSWFSRSGVGPPGRQRVELASDDPAVLKTQVRDR